MCVGPAHDGALSVPAEPLRRGVAPEANPRRWLYPRPRLWRRQRQSHADAGRVAQVQWLCRCPLPAVSSCGASLGVAPPPSRSRRERWSSSRSGGHSKEHSQARRLVDKLQPSPANHQHHHHDVGDCHHQRRRDCYQRGRRSPTRRNFPPDQLIGTVTPAPSQLRVPLVAHPIQQVVHHWANARQWANHQAAVETLGTAKPLRLAD